MSYIRLAKKVEAAAEYLDIDIDRIQVGVYDIGYYYLDPVVEMTDVQVAHLRAILDASSYDVTYSGDPVHNPFFVFSDWVDTSY